jgi:hypothetical protein
MSFFVRNPHPPVRGNKLNKEVEETFYYLVSCTP